MNRLNSLWLMLALALGACAGPGRAAAPGAFDPKPWLSDLDELEQHLGSAYANLEWKTAHDGVDAQALDRQARQNLRAATSADDAIRALAEFLFGFHDPHLSWSGKALPARVVYDLELQSDGSAVIVHKIGETDCGAAAGDVVLSLQGEPALQVAKANLALARMSSPGAAWDDALRLVTSSRFAPHSGLALTVSHAGREVRCQLAPKAPSAAPPEAAPSTSLAWSLPGASACAALGVGAAADPFGFDPRKHPDLQLLPEADNSFGAGVVHLSQGKKLGWIRIPLFEESVYPRTCAQVWDEERQHRTGSCDAQCQDDFRDRALATRFLRDFGQRLAQLQAAQVSALVVDVTDNGGGTDWVSGVAAALAPTPLQCAEAVGTHHPHWQSHFRDEQKALEACRDPSTSPALNSLVDRQLAWNAHLLQQSLEPCDLTPLFHGGAPGCSNVLDHQRQVCEPAQALGALRLPSGCHRFRPLAGAPPTGKLAVPVFVLVNRYTASAAEELAAVLRDNQAATVVGERTLGAGCGYTDNGIPLTLSHSGISIRVPDCVRFRADGTNEIEGIKPDVTLAWTLEDMGGRWSAYAEKALAEADRLFKMP